MVLHPDGSTTTAVPADAEAITVDSVAEGRRELVDASGATADPAAVTTAPMVEALLERLGLGAEALGGTPTPPAPTGPTEAPATVAVIWPEDCP